MRTALYRISILFLLWCLTACAGATQGSTDDLSTNPDPGTSQDYTSQPALPSSVSDMVTAVLEGDRAIAPLLDQDVFPVMLYLLNTAKEDVCMLEFVYTKSSVTESVKYSLIYAAERGVSVKVLTDDESDDVTSFVMALNDGGADARMDTSGTAHSKMLVVDQSIGFMGSTNLSYSSLKKNREANIIVRDPTLVGALHNYCTLRHANPTEWRDMIEPSTGTNRLYGDGRIDEAFLGAVQNATERIDAVIYTANPSPQFPDGPVMNFLNALGDAAARGVQVQIVMEKSDYDDVVNSLNHQTRDLLQSMGVTVRFEEIDRITHSKLLVADDEAVVATGNWTYGGFETNHEMALRIGDSDTVTALRAYAKALFETSN
ncbi:MAG: hypothetical protein CMH54_12035 [Myxococcales bacterium]|nr:hypothetical protein [Myxococcales bacterium]